jgi:serine/threonine protein kinase
LDHVVAAGATASLVRATDSQSGRSVAIKIFERQDFGRIQSEMEILRKVAHRGVPRLLAGTNTGYLVLEWVEGKALREIVDSRNKPRIERSVALMCKVCEVLAHVHSLGIAHLDLKPEHIMVDREDNITIIDFGAARPVNRLFALLSRSRRTGTPDYASPEQIKGRPSGVRSDVYSLGLILYEMLGGELPFSGVASDVALNLRLHRDPVPLHEIDSDIPEELSEIVERAIQRHPMRRHASASEFGVGLDQFRQAHAPLLLELLD